MPETYKHHAFISYSRRDFDEVNTLLQKLQSEVPEFKYWFDLDGIESGDEFVRKIVSAIDDSERILFMLSDNSINSQWAEQEVMYARNSGKRIIPILLKGAKLKGWFLFTFGNIDSIDTQDPRQVSKLISNLQQWCRSAESQSPEPIPTQIHRENNSKQAPASAKPVKTVKKPTAAKKEAQKEVDYPIPEYFGDKWGYINKKGEIVIPGIYDDAWNFSDGLSKVKKNGKWGFIDVNGCEVIPLIYEEAGNFSENLVSVRKRRKWGFVDEGGNLVIPFIYNEAFYFSDGLAMVRNGKKWGFIDKSGEILIPFIYDDATSFSEGRSKVKKDGKWGIINIDGATAIPLIYDFIYPYSEGLAVVARDGKYGVIDYIGDVVIPFIYDFVYGFSEGRALVKKDGEEYYIDKNGHRIE